jgi:hypothetical protein
MKDNTFHTISVSLVEDDPNTSSFDAVIIEPIEK